MVDKVTLNDVTNLENQTSAVTTINSNNDAIVAAMANTLSRDGTSPNEMESELDMNNNRIINLPTPVSGGDPATKDYVDAIAFGGTPGSPISVSQGGTGGTTPAVARTNLGLVIGTDVQPYDADLDVWAGKTPPSGAVVGTTDTQTITNKTISMSSNTISGTAAEFDAACSDKNFLYESDLGVTVQPFGPTEGGVVLSHLVNAYDPTTARSVVENGASILYNHVPSITMNGTAVDVIWQGHPSSDVESTAGQVIYLRQSSDGGATWGTKHTPFNSGSYSTNPMTPTAVQAEPHLIMFNNVEYCFWAQRGTAGQEAMIMSTRNSSGGLWTNYRARVNTTTNVLSFSSTDLSGAAGSGFTLTYKLQGDAYQLVPSKPYVNNDTLIVPLVLIDNAGGFGSIHWVSCMYSTDGTTWTMGGIVPHGVCGAADCWEPTLIKSAEGLFVMHIRDINGNENERQVYSLSADLLSWSACEYSDENVHSVRPRVIPITSVRSMMLMPSHSSQRNALSISFSNDARAYPVGHTFTNEVDGTDFVHYCDACLDGSGNILIAYSQGLVATNKVYDIRFVKLSQTLASDVVYSFTSRKNAVELDNAAYFSEWSGGDLVINPRSVGSLELIGEAGYITLRFKVTAVPTGAYYPVAVLGNAIDYLELSLRNDAGTPRLYVNAELVDTPIDCLEWMEVQIGYDKRTGFVSAFGAQHRVGPLITCHLGDAWNLSTGPQAGDLVFDIDGCRVSEVPYLRNQLEPSWYASRTSDGHVVFGGSVNQIQDAYPWSFIGDTFTKGNGAWSQTGNAADCLARIDRDAGFFGYFAIYTGGVARWFCGVNNTAESGSDAGSNFIIRARNDAGANIGDALVVTRSNMNAEFAAKLTSKSATAGVGYSTGAGGTVTQATNKATAVVLNKVCGKITMNAAALAADTTVTFTLTNSVLETNDVLILNPASGGTPGAYTLNARVSAGQALIDVRNVTAGSLSEALVISFVVVKAVTA